jgi:hypothetical protein
MEIPTNHEQQRSVISNRENLRRVFREMDNANGPWDALLGLPDYGFRLFLKLVKCTFWGIILLILTIIGLKCFLLFAIWMQDKM